MHRELAHAECGYCGLEGPDSFGNYDLNADAQCPIHGEQRMSYANWTDKEWSRLTDLVRQDGLALSPEALHNAAEAHMHKGAAWRLAPVDAHTAAVVARNVGRVQCERRGEKAA